MTRPDALPGVARVAAGVAGSVAEVVGLARLTEAVRDQAALEQLQRQVMDVIADAIEAAPGLSERHELANVAESIRVLVRDSRRVTTRAEQVYTTTLADGIEAAWDRERGQA